MREYLTDDYQVVVGEGTDKRQVYHIINKDSFVVEYEDHFLTRTIDTMMQLQVNLDEIRGKLDKPAIGLAIVGAHDGAENIH